MSDDFDIRLERKLESKADGRGGGVTDVRRIELITGAGRRRRWSSEDKARIVVESLADGVSVSEVARRHGLSPQQLFAWRREARGSFHEAGNTAPADRSVADLLSQLIEARCNFRTAAYHYPAPNSLNVTKTKSVLRYRPDRVISIVLKPIAPIPHLLHPTSDSLGEMSFLSN